MTVMIIAARSVVDQHTDIYFLDPKDIVSIQSTLDKIVVFLFNGKELHTQKPIRFVEKYGVDTIVPH
jgi:hypothetical protein